MDPITLAAIVLGAISVFEMGGLAYSAYNLSEKKVTAKIKHGITETINDPKFQSGVVEMMVSERTVKLLSKALMARFQAMADGARGYDIKTKKQFMAAVTEDPQVSAIVEMLPKKAQAMVKSNPDLIQAALEFVGPYIGPWIQQKLGGIMDGQAETA